MNNCKFEILKTKKAQTMRPVRPIWRNKYLSAAKRRALLGPAIIACEIYLNLRIGTCLPPLSPKSEIPCGARVRARAPTSVFTLHCNLRRKPVYCIRKFRNECILAYGVFSVVAM